MRRFAAGALLVALAALAGCAGKKPIIPPEKLWSEAEEAYHDEAYELAVERYKALLDQHPFDARAEEAELKIAQSHYAAGRWAEAIAAFGDFERMHPTSPELASVEYQLGMSYLAQATTTDRDQQAHTNALTYFRNLIDRFPNSPWAEKARLRVRECREALAKHEAHIARYYLKQKNLKAAEARLRGLLTEYPETDATAEALYAFAQTYAARDEAEGATLALATLARHHPDGTLGREAQRRLTEADASVAGDDPLALLVARIDRMRQQADRQKLPTTVSAYPDIAGPDGVRR
ncbi:MAG TPA: outer membrane protein assembly factor BamD [Candidatus Binatia bacterium]|nr:outer membrane protein assembly factor BamD [Candidatus Binatia bacterium]